MNFPDFPLEEEPETLVSFNFEDVEFELPVQEAIVNWLLEIAAAEKKPVYELNIIFCSDEYLRQINVEYLRHDYYTDIITFPYTEGAVHGDLFISSERVTENARAHGVSFLNELCRVMAHGVLHLAGYGDKTPEEVRVMREKEDFYLKKWPIR